MIDLEQGSEEWLQWRQNSWCASEAGIIMMCAPSWMQYRTWDDLRLVKAGFAEYDAWTKAMFEHGHEREKEVRDWFNEKYGYGFQPVCVESSKYPNMTASLDGHIMQHEPSWIEIKCPAPLPDSRKRWYDGVRTFEDLPDYHRWQVYHQYAALDSDAGATLYYIIAPMDQVPIVIRRHFTWQDRYEVEELYGQWKKWAAYEQPGRDDADWRETVSAYNNIKEQIDSLSRELSIQRSAMIALAENSGLNYGCGFKVIETERKGAVDKQQMRDLGVKCVCEEYRKPSTTGHQIRRQP